MTVALEHERSRESARRALHGKPLRRVEELDVVEARQVRFIVKMR